MKIIALSGSRRRASFNTGLLRYATTQALESLSIELADLSDLPLLSVDSEAAGDLRSAGRLGSMVSEDDDLLIAAPKYNYSMTGVLKNAIDWLPRAYLQDCRNGD